jgi:hypothetical protein
MTAVLHPPLDLRLLRQVTLTALLVAIFVGGLAFGLRSVGGSQVSPTEFQNAAATATP